MIEFINNYFEHSDGRGYIKGLINKGSWQELNMIFTINGVTRGNHYHKDIFELFIILEGSIDVVVQRVRNNKFYGKEYKYLVKNGDVFIIEPMVNHVFYVKTDAKWINALSKKLNNGKDLFRINEK